MLILYLDPPLCPSSMVDPFLCFQGSVLPTFARCKLTIFVYQMIIDQTTRDNSVRSLLSKMNEVYTFLMKEELRDIESMKTVVERICYQTLECSYFIREYSQNKNFRKLC
jgi:hypothetical protein